MLHMGLLLWVVTLMDPLGLSWQEQHNEPPKIENYRYLYGDVDYGLSVYTSKEDSVFLIESEIQVYYFAKRISKALLILGPAGIDDDNCLEKHNNIVGLLNKKYGHYKHREVQKDPIARDLFYTSVCKPVQLGLYEIKTVWKLDDYRIVVDFFGAEDGYFIEIEYTNLKKEKDRKKSIIKNMLEKL